METNESVQIYRKRVCVAKAGLEFQAALCRCLLVLVFFLLKSRYDAQNSGALLLAPFLVNDAN